LHALFVADAVRNASLAVVGDDAVTSSPVTSSPAAVTSSPLRVRAGDALLCTALGNPAPRYTVTTEPASAAASADDDAAPVVDASRGGHVRLGSSLIGRGGRAAGVT